MAHTTLFEDIRTALDLVGVLIKRGGTATLPAGTEIDGFGITNELVGGPFLCKDLFDLAKIPRRRMVKGCKATVNEHKSPIEFDVADGTQFDVGMEVTGGTSGAVGTICRVVTNKVFVCAVTGSFQNGEALDDDNSAATSNITSEPTGNKTVLKKDYYLSTLPPINDNQKVIDISDSYDISLYWRPDFDVSFPESTEEVQYAPDVNGKRPQFAIGADWYNNGETSPIDSTVIWVNTADITVPHKWLRRRPGSDSDWGIPELLFSLGEETFIDQKFKWVLKTDPDPLTPPQLIDGLPNNNPAGWDDVPDDFPGADWAASIVTHNLWRIVASKLFDGNLIGSWSVPTKLSNDPNLVQFGVPSSSISTPDTVPADWHDDFRLTDSHMVTRKDLGGGVFSAWVVTRITNEQGIFQSFVFKNFPLGTQVTKSDRPTVGDPFGLPAPNDWFDTPPAKEDDKVTYMSKGNLFSNRQLVDPPGYSTPQRWDGQDTITPIINFDTSLTFKKDPITEVTTPANVTLTAKLLRGIDELTSGLTYKWFKGTNQPGNQLGDIDNDIVVTPADVTNNQLYTVEITFEGAQYETQVNVIDVTDGVGFIAVIAPDDGFIFKNQAGTKTFNPEFYINGVLDNTNVTFVWKLDGIILPDATFPTAAIDGNDVLSIDGSDITTQNELTLEATYTPNSTTYIAFADLVDVDDGNDLVVEYSTDPLSTAPGSVSNFTTDPTDANWARFSTDGGTTFNTPFQIRGEAANANAGMTFFIFRNVESGSIDDPPSAPTVPTSGSIIPSGWTKEPQPFAGSEDLTFMASHNFVLVPGGDTSILDRVNWSPISGDPATYSNPVRTNGLDGVGIGVPGDDGWSPQLAVVQDGERRVHQLVGWIGGGGSPPGNVGDYLGSSGFTSDITLATDIRGKPAVPATAQDLIDEGIVESLGARNHHDIGLTFTDLPNSGELGFDLDTGEFGPDFDKFDWFFTFYYQRSQQSGPSPNLATANSFGGEFDIPKTENGRFVWDEHTIKSSSSLNNPTNELQYITVFMVEGTEVKSRINSNNKWLLFEGLINNPDDLKFYKIDRLYKGV